MKLPEKIIEDNNSSSTDSILSEELIDIMQIKKRNQANKRMYNKKKTVKIGDSDSYSKFQ